MNGTVVCCVDETDDGRRALAHALEVCARLEMRLVIAHVAEVPVRNARAVAVGGDAYAFERDEAILLLDRLAREFSLDDSVDRRVAVGDPSTRLAQIAAEEAADLLVVGSRRRGRLRSRLTAGLAEQLQAETPVPVLVAIPNRYPLRHTAAIA